MNFEFSETTSPILHTGSLSSHSSESYSENLRFIENQESVAFSSSSDYPLSPGSGRGIGLSLSPSTAFNESDVSIDDLDLSPLPEQPLNSDVDRVVQDYEIKLNLTENVMNGICKSGKTPLKVFSELDPEKNGFVQERVFRKYLQHCDISLSDQEFASIFSDFCQKQQFDYLRFLQSWSKLSMDLDTSFSLKRTYNDHDSIGSEYDRNTKRRVSFGVFDEDAQQQLLSQISLLVAKFYGNSTFIFNELKQRDGFVYLSDLAMYFLKYGIRCSVNQVTLLLAPYCQRPDRISLSEFHSFMKTIKTETDSIVHAFPQTFGRTLHINLSSRRSSHLETTEGLRYCPSVSQNLDNLPLYRMIVDMNELSSTTGDEDVTDEVYPLVEGEMGDDDDEDEDAIVLI